MRYALIYLIYLIGWFSESSYTRWANETDDVAQ